MTALIVFCATVAMAALILAVLQIGALADGGPLRIVVPIIFISIAVCMVAMAILVMVVALVRAA